jgi:hypothetical protein
MYPDVRGVIVDRNSAKGIVVVYRHGSPIQQAHTRQEVTGEPYLELTVRDGQMCVVYGKSTVLYYKPRKGLQNFAVIDNPGCRVGNPNSYAPPSLEEAKLRCIASTTMSSQPRVFFPPEPQDKHNRRKRKLFESSQSAPEKTAHSVVEKRYPGDINDKLAMFRDSVPSLRVMDKHSSCGEEFTTGLRAQ